MPRHIHWMIYGLIIGGVLVAFSVIFRSNVAFPDLLPAVAGCYEGNPGVDRQLVIVTPSGMLNVNKQTTKVEVYRDREGFSLNPERKVVVSDDKHNLVLIKSGNPLLIRFNRTLTGFFIISEGGPGIEFNKIPCGNP